MQKASPFDWLERILMCHTGKGQMDRLLIGLGPPTSAGFLVALRLTNAGVDSYAPCLAVKVRRQCSL